MDRQAKIYVAGHNGMVGNALVRHLVAEGFINIVTRSHSELDLTRQMDVEAFFRQEKPEYVFIAAAMVGGILANAKNHAQFLINNLKIECNVIECAYKGGVKKLLFLGSSCIYPYEAKQPIQESALLSGPLEPTNEGYALAKIVGLKLCEYYNRQHGADFVSVMPCNIYGYGDNFNLESSHMLPALIRRFHEAKESNANFVTLWGTGNVYRELLFVDDLASACLLVMNEHSGADFLNIGYGKDFTVSEIAQMVKEIVGFHGDIKYDTSKPDGAYRKIVDITKISAMGWKPEISLQEGIALTYEWYKNTIYTNTVRK